MPTVRLRDASEYPEKVQKGFELAKSWFGYDFPQPPAMSRVMAWVKPQPGAALTEDDLVAACRAAIARYKVPRYWRIVDGFPMTVTGKVQKFRLRELAAR